MINIDKVDFLGQGFDKNGVAIVSYKKKDGVFCINTEMEKISGDFDYINRAGDNLYIFPDEFGSEAYFKFENGKFTKASKTFAGCLGQFNNGIAIVQYDEGKFKDREVSYYINRNFERISPLYLYIEEFNEKGIARVLSLYNDYKYINTDFEQISPLFKEVSLPDKNDIVTAREDVDGNECESYYKLKNGQFKRVSEYYKRCKSFTGDVAVVQDLYSGKWVLINDKFNQISNEFDEISYVVNAPQVLKAQVNGKKVYLTETTGSKVTNPNLYSEVLRLIDSKGYESVTEELYNSQMFNMAKRQDWADLEVAIKDYLIKNSNRIGYNRKTKEFYVSSENLDIRGKTTKALSRWIEQESKNAPLKLKNLIAEHQTDAEEEI